MFSLIITIISVVLVTALALATVYYGGSAFKQGKAAAEAARYVNDGQQLNAATALFQLNKGAYPSSLEELVGAGYLSAIPASVASAELHTQGVLSRAYSASLAAADIGVNLIIPSAQAAESTPTWMMPMPNKPLYVYSAAASEAVCREINRKVRGDDGILSKIVDSQAIQCYGTTSLTIVASLGGTGAAPAYAAEHGGLADAIPSRVDDTAWSYPPTSPTAPVESTPPGAPPTSAPTGDGFGNNPEVGPAPDPSTEFTPFAIGSLDSLDMLPVRYNGGSGYAGVALGVLNTGTAALTDPTFSIVSNVQGKWGFDDVPAGSVACNGSASSVPAGEYCQVNLKVGIMEPGDWTASMVVSYTTQNGRRTQTVPMRYQAKTSYGSYWTTSQQIPGTEIDSPLIATMPSAAADTYLVDIYNNSPTHTLAFGSVSLDDSNMTVSHTCGATLAPQGRCMVTVAWPEGAAGDVLLNHLRIQMTDFYYGTTTKVYPVAISLPSSTNESSDSFNLIWADPAPETLGHAWYGGVLLPVPVYIQNTTTETISSPSLVLNQTGTRFYATANGEGNAYGECEGRSLAAGETCQINMLVDLGPEPQFAPAKLTATYSVGGVSVSKTSAVAPTLLAPPGGFWYTDAEKAAASGDPMGDFDVSVPLADSALNQFRVVVTNPSSTYPLTLARTIDVASSSGATFSASHNCPGALPPGASCEVYVRNARLPAAGEYFATVTMAWSDHYVGMHTKSVRLRLNAQ